MVKISWLGGNMSAENHDLIHRPSFHTQALIFSAALENGTEERDRVAARQELIKLGYRCDLLQRHWHFQLTGRNLDIQYFENEIENEMEKQFPSGPVTVRFAR
jgi:hypothetical protein